MINFLFIIAGLICFILLTARVVWAVKKVNKANRLSKQWDNMTPLQKASYMNKVIRS